MNRRWAPLQAILVLAVCESAIAEAGRLKVGVPQTRLVASLDEVHSVCRTKAALACTVFVDEALSTRCVVSGNGWQIQATATWTPVMYMTSERYVRHERIHVTHVGLMAGEYVKGLAAEQFDSEDLCLAAARAAESSFTVRMNGFRILSNKTYR
jgi:hypothetical protein